MSEKSDFTLELEQLDGYQFRVRFDLDGVDDLVVDEPPPLGQGSGPNPSRMLALAAANCLSASLLYCVSRNRPPAGSLRARVHCRMARNDRGRLRIGGLAVTLEVDGELADAARMKRCLELFEEFCVVSASLRDGLPVAVEVVTREGEVLHSSAG